MVYQIVPTEQSKHLNKLQDDNGVTERASETCTKCRGTGIHRYTDRGYIKAWCSACDGKGIVVNGE